MAQLLYHLNTILTAPPTKIYLNFKIQKQLILHEIWARFSPSISPCPLMCSMSDYRTGNQHPVGLSRSLSVSLSLFLFLSLFLSRFVLILTYLYLFFSLPVFNFIICNSVDLLLYHSLFLFLFTYFFIFLSISLFFFTFRSLL